MGGLYVFGSRRVRVALLLGAFWATLVFASVALAQSGLPYTWYFSEWSLGATSVRLCWGGESATTVDSWTVRRARGTRPPPPDATPVATVVGDEHNACYDASGLVTDEPYTFTVTGHAPSGDGPPAAHTLAARRRGTYLLNGGSREKFPWDDASDPFHFMQLGVTAKYRRWHAIFFYTKGVYSGTSYSTKGKSGWTQPKLAAGSLDAVAAANASAFALTWSDAGRHRYRPRYRLTLPSGTGFGPRHTVPGASPRDNAFASALDKRGHLHLLSTRSEPGDPVIYASNGSGKWRQQVIPAAWGCDYSPLYDPCPDRSLLTWDPVSNRIVIIAQGFTGARIGSKRASASRFGTLRALTELHRRHLHATSLTSRANRVTLGLAAKPASNLGTRAKGPLYVYAAGQVVRIPGTTANDENLLVAASSPDRVKLAWQRTSATWDRHQQGIWTAESIRNRKTGRWSIRNISHRSDSHYDDLESLTVTAAGRALVAYKRPGLLDYLP